MQVTDLALARLSRQRKTVKVGLKALPGDSLRLHADLQEVLQQLRLDTLEIWEGGG